MAYGQKQLSEIDNPPNWEQEFRIVLEKEIVFETVRQEKYNIDIWDNNDHKGHKHDQKMSAFFLVI